MTTFYVSQKYRTPVCLLADGMLGQMMEPAVVGEYPYPEIDQSDWALDGANGREPRFIASIEREQEGLRKRVVKMFKKYNQILENENLFEEYKVEGARLVITAFGSIGRIANLIQPPTSFVGSPLRGGTSFFRQLSIF